MNSSHQDVNSFRFRQLNWRTHTLKWMKAESIVCVCVRTYEIRPPQKEKRNGMRKDDVDVVSGSWSSSEVKFIEEVAFYIEDNPTNCSCDDESFTFFDATRRGRLCGLLIVWWTASSDKLQLTTQSAQFVCNLPVFKIWCNCSDYQLILESELRHISMFDEI